MGGLWKVPAGGGTPELITDALPMPGGVAVGADGTVYVTTCAVCPGGWRRRELHAQRCDIPASGGAIAGGRSSSIDEGRAATPGPCYRTVRVPDIPACR